MSRGDDMNKQDSNGSRTAQDIERKYDFAKMLGLSKNVETQEKGLKQIQNILNDMLDALIINLKDVLDSQSDVSLWFYSGIPTNETEPYISWQDPTEHYGDIYYDTNEGKVYQFYESSGVWEVNANPDLLRAMALTNSEIDTTIDHERKVFFTTPITPYSSGDWWILNDGTLKICQLGRTTGDYQEQDFINSSNYTPTIAESFDEVIKVLKGTITTLSEDYVQFTDLATGGSTTIAGENIKTGSIMSNNYAPNIAGMLINLLTGIIDTKNFKTDVDGNIYLGTGGKVIGGDGLLSNLIYNGFTRGQMIVGNGDFLPLGRVGGGDTLDKQRNELIFSFDLPDGFTISEAKIHLFHVPIVWTGITTGFSRNLKLYKGSNLNNLKINYDVNYGSIFTSGATQTEIQNAFGENGFTGTSNSMTNASSIDIKDYISTTETNYLIIKDSNNAVYTDNANIYGRTGGVFAYLEILGYKSLEGDD